MLTEDNGGIMLSHVFEDSCVFNVFWGGEFVCVNRLIGNNARFGLGIFPTFKAAIKKRFLAASVVSACAAPHRSCSQFHP